MPRSLFHYQRLVEAHLIALLAKRTVKLSRPDSSTIRGIVESIIVCRATSPDGSASFNGSLTDTARDFRKLPRPSASASRVNLCRNPRSLRPRSWKWNNRCIRLCASCTAFTAYRNPAILR